MAATVNPVPKGFAAPTPYLAIDGAAKAIDFYKKVFGAKEISRHEMEGRIGHAELEIGGGHIMLADEFPEMNFRGPQAYGGSAVMLHLYVEDVDAVTERALSAGATILRPVKNEFYGDRSGQFKDPFGHVWNVSTHVEDVTPEELERRSKAYMEAMKAGV
jgi:PhnB protein